MEVNEFEKGKLKQSKSFKTIHDGYVWASIRRRHREAYKNTFEFVVDGAVVARWKPS